MAVNQIMSNSELEITQHSSTHVYLVIQLFVGVTMDVFKAQRVTLLLVHGVQTFAVHHWCSVRTVTAPHGCGGGRGNFMS